MCLHADTNDLLVCVGFVPNTSGEKNETQYFYRDIWPGFIVRKRSEFGGTGKASANAHRRLFVRQLSVQHSEGREPSRLRTKS